MLGLNRFKRAVARAVASADDGNVFGALQECLDLRPDNQCHPPQSPQCHHG